MEQIQNLENQGSENYQNNQSGKANKKLMFLIAVLVVALISVAGVFLFKDKIFLPKVENEKSTQESFVEKENNNSSKTNDAKRKSDLNEIKIALGFYYDDNGKYPISNELTKLNNEDSFVYEDLLKYVDEALLKDPKDPKFYYGYKSDGSHYELTARLENLEDKECELLNSNLCIYKIVEGDINNGESPTDAYMKYYNALIEGNMEEMKKYLAKSMVEQMKQSGMENAKVLEMMQSMVPKEVKITDEKIKENNAVLAATGGFGSQEGEIEMVKENEKWKLLYESWELAEGYSVPLKEPILSGKTDVAVVDILFNQTGKDEADLKVIIKNNGKATIVQPVYYNFSINEAKEYGGFPTYNFKQREELEYDFSHAYSNYYNLYYKYKSDSDKQKPFKLEMVLTLDPKNELEEFDEGNNQITKTFYMQEM